MDDFGIYTWQDGRMYEGYYKEDKKHGFGIYIWSDSKQYSGWWFNGKQHGLGIFMSKDGKSKYGLWEDGKKLRWFKNEEVQLIEQGKASISELFENPEVSVEKISEFPLQFTEPSEFVQARINLKKMAKNLELPVDIDEMRNNKNLDQ